MKKLILLLFAIVVYSNYLHASDYDIVVDINGSGDYTSVQDAIDAAPSNSSDRTVIYIMDGEYYEVLTISSSKTNLTFIGESVDDVVLYYDNAANKEDSDGNTIGTSNSASVFINGDGFYAKNISFSNTSGTSYGPGVAVRCTADKAVFENCYFLGNQDTYYAHSGRAYHVDCYFEGTTDFIFGGAVAYFENCSLYSKGGSSLTAASTDEDVEFGYVFNNCTITGASSDCTDLGRPWRPYASVTFMNTSMSDAIKAQGWNNWDDEDNEETARFAEYNNSGDGSDFSGRPDWISYLSDSEAEEDYIMLNVLKATNADPQVTDNWDPTDVMEDEDATLTKHGVGSSSQTIDLGDAIEEFYYSWDNASTVTVSGMPDGITTDIDTDEQTVTFSGTPTESGTFAFTVTTTGASTNVSMSGTITINEVGEGTITFSATPADGYVTLNWSTSGIDVKSFQIMRDTDSDPSGRTRVGIAGSSTTSYTDSDVDNDTSYYYWLKVTDTDSNTYNSGAVEVTPSGDLDGIFTLSATPHDGYVTLAWSTSDIDIRNIQIYRDTDSDPSGRTRIGTAASDETSYEDSDVTDGETYYYWLKIIDTDSNTHNSGVVEATLPEGTITLTATAGEDYVTLKWTTSYIDDISSVQIYRDTDSDPSGRTRISYAGTDDTSYTDSDVSTGTTYYYWIKIIDADSNIYNSEATEATPSSTSSSSVSEFYNEDVSDLYESDDDLAAEISTYPNPVNDILNVKNASGVVFLFNIAGDEIYNGVVNSDLFEINMSGLPGGIYVLIVKDENNIYKQTIVKK